MYACFYDNIEFFNMFYISVNCCNRLRFYKFFFLQFKSKSLINVFFFQVFPQLFRDS